MTIDTCAGKSDISVSWKVEFEGSFSIAEMAPPPKKAKTAQQLSWPLFSTTVSQGKNKLQIIKTNDIYHLNSERTN